MKSKIIEGDLLQQNTEVIVNAWNRNIIPWWLLLPQGVSRAIKKQGGTKPFKELSALGPIELGGARLTGPGKLPFKAIIHVAGINMFWLATKQSISNSVINAMSIVERERFNSVAFPLIGSGSGNRGKDFSLKVMLNAFSQINNNANVDIVKFKKG
jgi:O-acetyl-ADP-ribose deacetylase (regulator of RNase III)